MIFYNLNFELFFEIFSGIPETAYEWIEVASIFVESVAVIIILFSLIFGTIRFILYSIKKKLTARERFQDYKHGLGKALLLSLEILVAADVIRTVALEPNVTNILGLGLLVVIRTFLSWSLVVEMDGHWPWKARPE
ncbi:MAG: DUF1622 domain-containing protein [Anaerolineales bacterium]|jgi:uncharacterized membrane protein